MRTLILTTAVLVAGLAMSSEATAAGRSPHQPSIGYGAHQGATVSLVGHHGYSRHGYSRHGYSHHGPSHHGYSPYRHHGPRYHHGCYPPVVVHPPVVIPYPANPYGYHSGYGYYHGGMTINTGRVGFSLAF